jgi:hypothetical protein
VIRAAVTSITYVWHYVVERLIYDDLVRPLIGGGRLGPIIALACIAAGAFALWRRMGKRA